MPSPQLVTLFTQTGGVAGSRTSLLFSAVLHGASIAGLSAGLMENPRIIEPRVPAYSVQVVHMTVPDPTRSSPAPLAGSVAAPILNDPPSSQSRGSRSLTAYRSVTKPRASQVLLQFHAPVIEIDQALVPSLLILAPRAIIEVRRIVPQAASTEAATKARPVVDLPADEAGLADVQITSTPFNSEKLNLPASSTSPVALAHSDQPVPAPQTRSEPALAPSPVRVLSLSDLKLVSGTFVVPRLATAMSPATNPIGDPSGKAPSQNLHAAAPLDSTPGRAAGTTSPTARHIALPRDGKFSMVMVGDSSLDAYPEAANTWNGRLAYTVYLHVGQPRSWILQYSLPRSAQAGGSGAIPRVDAPWPIDMLIPNIEDFSAQADAVVLHGFLNPEGHFEQLNVVFPPRFSRSAFLLEALKEWLFRPAIQNGQPTTLEILLVIPSQDQ